MGRLQGPHKKCFWDEKAIACCGGGLQILQVPYFKTCLDSEGTGFFISLYDALSCAEAQMGAYGNKCDKRACGGAEVGTLFGDWPRMLQVPFSPFILELFADLWYFTH